MEEPELTEEEQKKLQILNFVLGGRIDIEGVACVLELSEH